MGRRMMVLPARAPPPAVDRAGETGTPRKGLGAGFDVEDGLDIGDGLGDRGPAESSLVLFSVRRVARAGGGGLG
jgi:hypothetical protein